MVEFIKSNTKVFKVSGLNAEYQDSRILIWAECETQATKNGWGTEKFVVAKIFKDWKIQGNYTYFQGTDSEKEYKTVRPVLKAIEKWVYKMNNVDASEMLDIFWFDTKKVLVWTGVEKDAVNTRAYKKALKELEAKNTNIESVEEVQEVQEVKEPTPYRKMLELSCGTIASIMKESNIIDASVCVTYDMADKILDEWYEFANNNNHSEDMTWQDSWKEFVSYKKQNKPLTPFTVSSVAYDTYKKEAKNDNNISREVLERRLTAMINNATKMGQTGNKTVFKFGSFVMLVDEIRKRIETITWRNELHKGYRMDKKIINNLKRDYQRLGLNKAGNRILQHSIVGGKA